MRIVRAGAACIVRAGDLAAPGVLEPPPPRRRQTVVWSPPPASLPPMVTSKYTLVVTFGPFFFLAASAGWHTAARSASPSTSAVEERMALWFVAATSYEKNK